MQGNLWSTVNTYPNSVRVSRQQQSGETSHLRQKIWDQNRVFPPPAGESELIPARMSLRPLLVTGQVGLLGWEVQRRFRKWDKGPDTPKVPDRVHFTKQRLIYQTAVGIEVAAMTPMERQIYPAEAPGSYLDPYQPTSHLTYLEVRKSLRHKEVITMVLLCPHLNNDVLKALKHFESIIKCNIYMFSLDLAQILKTVVRYIHKCINTLLGVS